MMAFDLLEMDLPLLISLKVMKRLNLTISYSHTGSDVAQYKNTKFRLTLEQGHHWLPLTREASLAAVLTDSDNTGVYEAKLRLGKQ